MALNLDTRIPLLSVDQNFNPAKSFNDAADAAVKQQQMTISNRLEKMKADREMAQAEREARKAERYAQMLASMKQGTPAQMSEGVPATQSQYQFDQPEQTPGYNINDMLTGRVDPQAALGLLTQQPSNVTPGRPAVPPQELVPAVPGREPTVEDMMRMYGEASLGVGDFKEGIDTFKALGGYSKDMRPTTEGKPTPVGKRIKLTSPQFPEKGEAGMVVFNPATNNFQIHRLGEEFRDEDVAQERLGQGAQRIIITQQKNADYNRWQGANYSLKAQQVARDKAEWEQGGRNVKFFTVSNPDGTNSIKAVVTDRSGRQVGSYAPRDEYGKPLEPMPGQTNARFNARILTAAEEATYKLKALGEVGGEALNFTQFAEESKNPGYIQAFLNAQTRPYSSDQKQIIAREMSGLTRMVATVAGSGMVNSNAAIEAFDKMASIPEGASNAVINIAYLNLIAALRAGLAHPVQGVTKSQLAALNKLSNEFAQYPTPYDYVVFLKKNGKLPKDAGYKFDGVELSAPITREVVYDDDTGEFVPADEGGDGGYGGHNAAPAQPQVAPTQPQQSKPEMYMEYKQERAKAYKAGNYDLVRRMDAEALKDRLISALPKAGGK